MTAPSDSASTLRQRHLLAGLAVSAAVALGLIAMISSDVQMPAGAGRDTLPLFRPGSGNTSLHPFAAQAGNSGAGVGTAVNGPPATTANGPGPTRIVDADGNSPDRVPPVPRADLRNDILSLTSRGLLPDINGEQRVALEARIATTNPAVRQIRFQLVVDPPGLQSTGELQLRGGNDSRSNKRRGSDKFSVITVPTDNGVVVEVSCPEGARRGAVLALLGFRVLPLPAGSAAPENGIRLHTVKLQNAHATLSDNSVAEWKGVEASVRFREP
ncbi:MAG: hypothetical protein AB7K09_23675 [Planctomycetota bacterium]